MIGILTKIKDLALIAAKQFLFFPKCYELTQKVNYMVASLQKKLKMKLFYAFKVYIYSKNKKYFS